MKARVAQREALLKVLSEVERIINSCPTTIASHDIVEPITPNHLLLGRSSPYYKPCITKF